MSIFCMECGKRLDDNARFCPECGTPVQLPETETSPPFTLTKSSPADKKPVSKPPQPAAPSAPVITSYNANTPQRTNDEQINTNAAPMTYDRNSTPRVNYSSADVISVSRKSKAPAIIITIVLILLLAGAGVYVYFTFFANKQDKPADSSTSRTSNVSTASTASVPDSAPSTSDELDLRQLCYDSLYYDYSYTTIAADDGYVEIDTNPRDIDGYNNKQAYAFIEEYNSKLGFDESLIIEIKSTSESDGTVTVENDMIRVQWAVNPHTGLVVRYIKK